MALKIPPFSSLSPTMITTVCFLKNEINLDAVFSFLPVFPVSIKPHRSKKIIIPHQGIKGAIYSVRYRYQTRGIKRNSDPKYFPRTICLDLETKDQNINAKISMTNIQMCGSKNIETAREACQIIKDHIFNIGEYVEIIRKNPDLFGEVVNFLRENCRGRDDLILFDSEKIKEKLKEKSPLFQGIFSFCWRALPDFDCFADLEKELLWIPMITWISKKISSKEEVSDEVVEFRNFPIEFDKITKSMINYSYRLDSPIKSRNVAHLFDDGVFSNSFNPMIDHYINIKLPVEFTGLKIESRKKKNHTFVVYRTGTITQSGPSEESMEIAYNMFWEKIIKNYDEIVEKSPINVPEETLTITKP